VLAVRLASALLVALLFLQSLWTGNNCKSLPFYDSHFFPYLFTIHDTVSCKLSNEDTNNNGTAALAQAKKRNKKMSTKLKAKDELLVETRTELAQAEKRNKKQQQLNRNVGVAPSPNNLVEACAASTKKDKKLAETNAGVVPPPNHDEPPFLGSKRRGAAPPCHEILGCEY